jgi:thioredoxin reductase (NADPH)
VLEPVMTGGQVALTSEVENYPGFAEPVPGPLLTQAMEMQARRFGCAFESGEAVGLAGDTPTIEVKTTIGTLHPASLIIATGVRPRKLGIPGEDVFAGRGVSYCAVCDGPLFKNRDVAVVGGGDSALDEAFYLAGLCRKIYLVHRRDQFRGAQVAADRLRRTPNVELVLSSIPTSITGSGRVEQVEVESRTDGSKRTLDIGGIFIYVGSQPNTTWCREAVELDSYGSVKTDALLRTSRPGVFAAGDVRTTPLRQIATAVADGALAAMQAHRFLTEQT